MENMLNAIKDMPLKAAYYMGKRDAYRKEIADELTIARVKPTPIQIGRIKVYYLLADSYDERFAEEMGWI